MSQAVIDITESSPLSQSPLPCQQPDSTDVGVANEGASPINNEEDKMVDETTTELLRIINEQNRLLESDSRYYKQDSAEITQAAINTVPTPPLPPLSPDQDMPSPGPTPKKARSKSFRNLNKIDTSTKKDRSKSFLSHDEPPTKKEKLKNKSSTCTDLPSDGTLRKERSKSSAKEPSPPSKKDRSKKPSIPDTPTANGEKVPGSVTETDEPQVTKEEEVLKAWGSLIKNWEEIYKKNFKYIRGLVMNGVPSPLRGMVWQLLARSDDQEELKSLYPTLIIESSPFEKQILRDLNRTFPDHSFFKDKDGPGQESLLGVMKAYSIYDREVGYCQGSLFVAGMLLIHLPEEEAFCVFIRLMNEYKLREMYKPSMADLSLCFYQLESLVEELYPQLNIHFKAQGFHTSMYASPWFLTLFASCLPLSLAFRVMDMFLIDGLEVVFRVGLAILDHSHDHMINLDLEEMTKLFQKELKTIHDGDPHCLMEKAYKIKVSSKKLKKLEKEYIQQREKKLLEKSEISRLKDENYEFETRVIALEKECASLADKLLQGQVQKAKEEEEMFAMRREIKKLRETLAAMEEKTKEQQEETTSNTRSLNTTPDVSIKVLSKEKSVSAPSLRDDLSPVSQLKLPSSPHTPVAKETSIHVCKEEAEQVLQELGVTPLSTPSTPDVEPLLLELATSKIQRAEAMELYERKCLELRHSLQREEGLRAELEQLRQTVTELQTNITTLTQEVNKQDDKNNEVVCRHCHEAISTTEDTDMPHDTEDSTATPPSNHDTTTPPSDHDTISDDAAGPDNSVVIFNTNFNMSSEQPNV